MTTRSGNRANRSPPHFNHQYLFKSNSPNVSPTDLRTGFNFGDHLKDHPTPVTSDPTTISLQRTPSPTTISTHHPSNESAESSRILRRVGDNGATEKPNESSSFHKPASSLADSGKGKGDRRHSAASANTEGSQGSKSSAGARFRKHLPRIFGEDPKKYDAKNASDSNLPEQSYRPSWERSSLRSGKNRLSAERPISPGEMQPDAPAPSSEVTPWMYQSFHVSFNIFFFSNLL